MLGNFCNNFLPFYPLVSVPIPYAHYHFDEGDYNFLKVVTCGNVPLESSFQKIPRCVYTSTSLYEYRGWDSKAANPTHRRFTWGLRSVEVRKIIVFVLKRCLHGYKLLVSIWVEEGFHSLISICSLLPCSIMVFVLRIPQLFLAHWINYYVIHDAFLYERSQYKLKMSFLGHHSLFGGGHHV